MSTSELDEDVVEEALPVAYTRRRLRAVPHLLACVATVPILAVNDPRFGLGLLALTSMAYALYLLASVGGAYLTPSGVYFLASGVFIGLASYYLLQAGTIASIGDVRDLGAVAFLSTVATGFVVSALSVHWNLRWPIPDRHRSPVRAEYLTAPRQFQLRALLMVGASQVPVIALALGPLASAVGLGGVMMLVLASASRRIRLRWHGEALAVGVAFVVPVVWMRLEFQGGGRLTLAGLGAAALLIWNLVRPHRYQKIALLLAIPLFLLFSAFSRLDNDGRDRDSSAVSSGAGLESVYSPLDTFAELVTLDPARTTLIKPGPWFGRTFLHTAVLPIPRAIWEDKPAGFGSELTSLLRADLLLQNTISPTHSMAALVQGEWYVNFGFTGLVLMPIALGWFLARLDRAHAQLAQTGLSDHDTWWKLAILASLVSSLGDLCWVGSFTFFARGGLAAIAVWALSKVSRVTSWSPRRVATGTDGSEDGRVDSLHGLG